MKNPLTLLIGVIIALVLLSYMFVFQVRYDEVAVLATFGRADRDDIYTAERSPYFRWPWPIQRVESYPTTLQLLESQPRELLTADNYNIILSVFVIWKIENPLEFFTTAETVGKAQEYLRNSLANVENVIRGERFVDLVRVGADNAEGGRLGAIEERMLAQLRNDVGPQTYGVVIEQVGIRRILLPQDTTNKVAEAMRAVRQRLAQDALSAGETEAQAIINSATAIRDQIMDFARLSAEELRAQGDMAAAEYAQVFNQDEDFAIFLRKLETYRQMLSNRATVILPVDVLLHPGRGLLEREPAQDSE